MVRKSGQELQNHEPETGRREATIADFTGIALH